MIIIITLVIIIIMTTSTIIINIRYHWATSSSVMASISIAACKGLETTFLKNMDETVV